MAEIPVDKTVATIAIQLGRARYKAAMERSRDSVVSLLVYQEEQYFEDQRSPDPRGVVYYIRRGDFIKIGTTTKFEARMRELRPDEILATEPGSYFLEAERHQLFKSQRVGQGEYFHPCPGLTAHMLRLREEHGIPEQGTLRLSDGRKFLEEEQERYLTFSQGVAQNP